MAQRVAVYIDGFNLYYGLRSKGWRRYYWLDLLKLSEKLLLHDQRLVSVRYFTAPILRQPGNPGRYERQQTYLQALNTLSPLSIHYGYFLPKNDVCPECGASQSTFEEKMTDVNIAVALMEDAHDDEFDTAIIISGDSDLSRPTVAIRERYPQKRVIVAFPPNRTSFRLRQVSTGSFTIGRRRFGSSQLPDQVVTASGYPINKPTRWS